MRLTRETLTVAGLICAILSSCSDSDDDGVIAPPVNSPAVVGTITVVDTRVSPVGVSFALSDDEGDAAEIEVLFFRPGIGTPMVPTLLGSPDLANLQAEAGGTTHTFQWDFAADFGSSDLVDGVQFQVNAVDGVQSVVSTAMVGGIALGNDAPGIAVSSAIVGGAGVIDIPFQLIDSTDDVVRIVVEYDIEGDVPDAGFQVARSSNLPSVVPTPAVFYTVTTPSANGLDLLFQWDTEFDEPGRDFNATMRFSPSDNLVVGASASSAPILIDNNRSATAIDVAVTDARESPATVTFRLSDPEADTQRVDLFFVRAGSTMRESMTLAQPDPLDGLAADPGGSTHVRLWDFASDLGSTAFESGVGASVDVLEGSVVSSVAAAPFELGNDAPLVTAVVSTPLGEVTGDLDVTIRVADSTDDLVRIAIEYDILGDSPDTGFRPVRPTGLVPGAPTPAFVFLDVAADRLGVDLSFAWDVVSDEGTTDFAAVLRFTAADDLVIGPALESGALEIDNNASPRAEVDMSAFVAGTDEQRGIPIPFTVFDPEGDTAALLFQWRLQSGAFPALPTDAEAVRSILTDPALRRSLQIASEYKPVFSGRTALVDAASDPNGDKIRLPEVAGLAAGAAVLGPEGLELALLRDGRRPVATGNPWTLGAPIAALPIASGVTALVLDSASAGTWRLREMVLSSGAELRIVAAGSDGDPFAMAFDGRRRVVLAAGDGTSWSLLGVELESGLTTELLPTSLAPATGRVRGLAVLDASRVVLTVGTALVEVHTDSVAPTANVLFVGLVEPWGVAARGGERVFVADRGGAATALPNGAVFEIDLATLEVTQLPPGFTCPRALALAPDGTSLFAVVDGDPNDFEFEIVGRALGGTTANGGFELANGLVDGGGGLAAGTDGLLLLALPGSNDLAIGGGVEQIRSVTAYDPNGQVATVDAPFEPAARNNARWQLREPVAGKFAARAGSSGTFIWDSRDVAQGADVILRAVALDTDVGTSGADTQTPQTVGSPLEVSAVTFGVGVTFDPVAIASADFDRDGNLDVVTANAAGEDLSVFLQSSPGAFGVGPVLGMGVGSEPRCVVAADFTGNGLPDVAGADGAINGSGVRLFTQSGPGSFDSATIQLATGQVNALAVGDLDRNGELDLVVATPFAVGVHFGTGGALSTSPDLELPGVQDPRGLAVADLARDGDPNILVANAGNGELQVFEGPSFTALSLAIPPPVPSARAVSVAVSDLDSDGLRDVAVAYAGADVLAVFLQSPLGAFGAPSAVVGGASTTTDPGRVRIVDLNGDGHGDLVAAVANGTGLAVFFQSSGAFASVPDLELGVVGSSLGARDFVARDFDGDGSVDLLAAGGGSAGEVAAFLQARAGDFRSTTIAIEDPSTAEHATLVEPGDFNGDGRLDLALANRQEGHVTLHFQNAGGGFDPDPNGPIGQGVLDGVTGLAAGDLDGDGALDLVAAAAGANRIVVLLQTSPGVLTVTHELGSRTLTARPRSVALGDLDGDGDVDIVNVNTGGADLTGFLQSASGGFSPTPSFRVGGGLTPEPNTLLVRDLNGDGQLDFASANLGNQTSGVLTGVTLFLRGPSGFAKKPSQGLLTGLPSSRVADVAAGDLNGDGLTDLVAADVGGGALALFVQDLSGAFMLVGTLEDPEAAIAPSWVEVADIDGDGADDIVAIDDNGNRVLVFRQGAPGAFHLESLVDLLPTSIGGVSVALRVADLDGDGDADIVTADSAGGAQTVHFGGR